MDVLSLAFFAAAFMTLGAAATVLVARLLPLSMLQQAERHGRFIGLGEAQLSAVPAPAYRPRVQKEAMNVVRTSH